MIKNKAGKRSSIHHWNPFSFILGFTAFFSSISTIGKAITRYVGHKSNCQSVSPNLSNRKLPPPYHLLHPVANDPRPFTVLFIHFTSFSSLLPFFIFFFFSLFYSRPYRVMKNKSWIQVQAFDILVNYLSLFCIVVQSVSGYAWNIDRLGKCQRYISSVFQYFLVGKIYSIVRDSLVLIWCHSMLFSVFKLMKSL